jgi:pimeloyl-ACP methyl ester carboxylesterase
MIYVNSGDAKIAYDEIGEGELLVLVHGSWSDHSTWAAVVDRLAQSNRVVVYDRRGHSRSSAPLAASRVQHEDDLAALITELDAGPAFVVGGSYGGSIATGLACRRPELFRGLSVHEPPLASLMPAAAPEAAELVAAEAACAKASELIDRGANEEAAELFVEKVALGPGAWRMLPDPVRRAMVENAPTFAAEQRDQAWAGIDRDALARLSVPTIVTQGDTSPGWFAPIVAELARSIPSASVTTFAGAGHVPQLTHPEQFAEAIAAFAGAPVEPVAS